MEGKVYATIEDLLEDESFCRWATGASEEQAAFWKHWIDQHPGRQELTERAILVLKGPSFLFKEKEVSPQMIQDEWVKLKSRTAHKKTQLPAVPEKLVKKQGRRVFLSPLKIAATVAIIVVASFILRMWINNSLIEHQTPYGQQLSLILPDSTRVELNANSKLSYYTDNPRKVWLDGEAFFNVKKKPATGANFQVLTNDLTVEVLGTAFNVARNNDQTEVVLEEGKVKLNLNRDFQSELYLEPGEQVTFTANSTASVVKQKVRPQLITSWKEGTLQFEDVPLVEVMQRIKEIYGWNSNYSDDNLMSRKISIPLPVDDLDSALLLLSRAIGIEIEKVEEDNLLLLN